LPTPSAVQQDHDLSKRQDQFLRTYLLYVQGEADAPTTFELVRRGSRKILRSGTLDLPINVTDNELLDLARRGLIEVEAGAATVRFTAKTLALLPVLDETPSEGDPQQGAVSRVERLDVQVKAWLVASLVAAAFCLILLGVVVLSALDGRIPVTRVATMLTAISGFVTAVFIRNYNRANERVRRGR